ncbi:MAG: tRNA (N(6)-L-threonylcarbamoyladenosine(37)-C(2))-methylthiotransferase MtaB [Chloroflexota bacterium]|nr:MAG: tRNA (N(6)-L-threonylcarbamoyladenosine(37)-C(2))-methylthiotransferase MtaB [Chloroflexota bacterium]
MKIYLDMVGCRLNQSEIEAYAQQFQAAGHSLTANPADADLAIVNTCTVTVAAAADSRKMIRRVARKGAGQVLVTGCWATLEPQKASQLAGVSEVIPNDAKDEFVLNFLGLDREKIDQKSLERVIVPGPRVRTRAVIKAQDGCDNHCTFCITTIARGNGRSVPIEAVLRDVRIALRGGAQEVVLAGVHLGSWGHDFEERLALQDLVKAILSETDVPQVRLSSLEPWDVEDALIELLASERVARHLHLPLQSGCAATLRRMARKITPSGYATLLSRVRAVTPEAALTADVMVGFPGETEEEFAESLAFVREMNFAGGHTFTYSARERTVAAKMPNQVPHPIRKERNAAMREVLTSSAAEYRRRFVGRKLNVLWESATSLDGGGWELRGLTDNYLRVRAQYPRNLWNSITPVLLESTTPRGLEGKVTV